MEHYLPFECIMKCTNIFSIKAKFEYVGTKSKDTKRMFSEISAPLFPVNNLCYIFFTPAQVFYSDYFLFISSWKFLTRKKKLKH